MLGWYIEFGCWSKPGGLGVPRDEASPDGERPVFQMLGRIEGRGVNDCDDGGAAGLVIGGPRPGGAIGVLRGIMLSFRNAEEPRSESNRLTEGVGSWLLLRKAGCSDTLGAFS